MSNKCKSTCIDDQKNFCPVSNYQGGYCCGLEESCPRTNICSQDNPRAPNMFKYLACPNEKACGTKTIYPNINGTVIIREVEKYNAQMVKDDVCSYIIEAPAEMQELDRLLISIDKIENADVYVAKAKGYKWISHLDRIANNDQIFDTRMGW
jgi:hypothetical protein